MRGPRRAQRRRSRGEETGATPAMNGRVGGGFYARRRRYRAGRRWFGATPAVNGREVEV